MSEQPRTGGSTAKLERGALTAVRGGMAGEGRPGGRAAGDAVDPAEEALEEPLVRL